MTEKNEETTRYVKNIPFPLRSSLFNMIIQQQELLF